MKSLMQPSFIHTQWPAGQRDVRRVRFGGVLGDFEIGLDLILGGLREPVPLSFGLALRAPAAIGFQFS